MFNKVLFAVFSGHTSCITASRQHCAPTVNSPKAGETSSNAKAKLASFNFMLICVSQREPSKDHGSLLKHSLDEQTCGEWL
jgi:hypothetical protein